MIFWKTSNYFLCQHNESQWGPKPSSKSLLFLTDKMQTDLKQHESEYMTAFI